MVQTKLRSCDWHKEVHVSCPMPSRRCMIGVGDRVTIESSIDALRASFNVQELRQPIASLLNRC